MRKLATLLFCLLTTVLCEDKEPYRGRYIGLLNSYHHQVSGEVYAVDQYKLLLVNFNYDGNGADTFFWAGSSNRPGPQGFIVPDEYGKTNVLDRYFNQDILLTLPDNKTISDIKWFAIYDLDSQNTFGDVNILEDFEPPILQRISQLGGRSHNVSSESLEVLDAKTIKIPQLIYDGLGKDAHFWIGLGPQPSSKGTKVPDEYGYLDPIRAYKNEDVILRLPGHWTVFEIDWLSIFDLETKENFGSVIIPDELNVPPSLVEVFPVKSSMPNCVQLHKDLQVGWDIFGRQITFQLVGQVAEDEYLSFGISGSTEKSQMIGSDITIAYVDGHLGYAVDYNVTAMSPCNKVLGQYKGVCPDVLLGGIDNNQLHTAIRENGINTITYRRDLVSSDHGDKEYLAEGDSFFVWALGRLNHKKEPMFHDIYPKGNIKIELNREDKENNCYEFTKEKTIVRPRDPWEKTRIHDRSIRTFKATLGPAGGRRGYQGITGMPSPGLVWYINGFLAPELWLQRGLTYTFKIFGGNNPHSAETYHPFIITDEPYGGYDRLSEEEQQKVRVLAGVEFTTRRRQPKPTAAGPLCIRKHNGKDRRLDDDFATFKKFNRTLVLTCEEGEPATLEVTPNTTWPDIVYYNSFTHSNMGWKIHITDSYSKGSSADSTAPHLIVTFVVILLGMIFSITRNNS